MKWKTSSCSEKMSNCITSIQANEIVKNNSCLELTIKTNHQSRKSKWVAMPLSLWPSTLFFIHMPWILSSLLKRMQSLCSSTTIHSEKYEMRCCKRQNGAIACSLPYIQVVNMKYLKHVGANYLLPSPLELCIHFQTY